MKLFKLTKRNILKIAWIVIILGFPSSVLQAQPLTFIRGVIKNQDTHLPIEGVNIQLQNTNIGTSTNSQGVFELRVSNLPAILTVTHIAFFGKQIFATQRRPIQ